MDDKIKAYVKNNIRKTAQTYLRIAKQPIEQAKFIGSVGREVSKAPAFLGKTAATGLIKIPTQVATNGRVDLAKNKYIGKAFMTDRQINQVSATPTAPLKFLGQNVLAGAKTAATAFGAPAMATRQGLTSLGASSLLGGGLNRVMGQDARQGAIQGAALAPTIAGITKYSNPLIEQGVAKFAPRIAGKMPNILKEGIARVPGNVLEGGVIDATLGRRPLSLGSAAIDAATAFIPGNPNLRRTAQNLDGVNPRAYKMHPDDVVDLDASLTAYKTAKGFTKEDRAQQLKTLQNIVEHYAPGWKHAKTPDLIKAAEALMDIATGKTVRQTDFPKMGIVEDAKVGKNSVAQERITDMTPDDYLRKAFEATDGRLGGDYDAWLKSNLDPKKVMKYTEAMQKGDKFPTISIDNVSGSQDGIHRALAYKANGINSIPVSIKGSPEDFVSGKRRYSQSSLPQQTGVKDKILKTLRSQEGFIRIGAGVGKESPQVSAKSSSEGIIPQDQTKAFNINKARLKMNKGQSKQFDRVVKTMQPELEKIKGKPLTFDEVTEEAAKSDLLRKSIGREGTANFEAQLTATRNRMVELNNQIDKLQKGGDIKSAERLTKELIQHIRTVSGAAADAGRKLGSFRITAEARPFREQLLSEIIKNQKYSDEQANMLVKSAAGVDFNDTAQVTKFFKEVVKPSVGQMLEEYRYINLLSSPRTHITNIFSNAIQAGILNPATKLTTGIVDPVARALTGKARENYIGEVPMYYRGMFSSFPDAFKSLSDVFQGKKALTNLDFKTMQRMPSKANIITKSLEGFDVFFRTLIEGGEKQALDYKFGKMGLEVGQETIDNIASQRGQYYTFRQGFDTPGQGAVLDWFDKGTEAIMQLRRVPGVSWFVPFIQTPMNIVKQGYEYSPAGFSTMIKADNKTEQFSKALLGSAVFTGAGYLALNDRLTYAAPRDPEQKKLFYASGKQPYSVKIGDKWVSFSKIGPLAYPLALAGAIKYAFEDNPSAVTDDTFEKVTKSLTGAVGFFSDQSYMQGIGDMIKGLEGQEGFNFSKIAGNVGSQYIPVSSFQRWVNNIIDPVYRKPKTLKENLQRNFIGQTGDMGYYEDPLGEPSKRQFPLQNAFSPVGVTKENPQWNPLLDMRQQELQGNAILKQQEADLQEKVGLNPASADSGDTKMDAYTAKMQEKMARNRVELTGEAERIEDKIIYQTDSGTGTIDLGKVSSLSEDNKYLKAIKSSKAYTLAGDIIDADIPDEQKNQALSDIGIDREDAEYYSIASQSNDLKSIYLLEVAQAFVDKSGNRQDMIDVLVSQRRKVNGDMIASDGVLDNLYNDGYITYEERKALKDIDFDAEGKLKVKPASGGKKLKAIKAPTYKLSKKARQKLRKPKLASIKLEGSKKLKATTSKKYAPIKLVNSKK